MKETQLPRLIQSLPKGIPQLIIYCSTSLVVHGVKIRVDDQNKRHSIKHMAKTFIMLDGKLLGCTRKGLKTAPFMNERNAIFKTFIDSVGHQYKEMTKKVVVDHYWWVRMHADNQNCMKSCEWCQKKGHLPPFCSTSNVPLKNIFETYSIDFAGPVPISSTGKKYLLIAFENFTGWRIEVAATDLSAATVTNFIAN